MAEPLSGLRAATTTAILRRAHGVPNSVLTGVIAGLTSIVLAGCGLVLPAKAHPSAARTACYPSSSAAPALLPVSPAGLAAATSLAGRFAAAYSSYRYDQPPGTYLARLRPLATASLYRVLASSAQAPGVQEQRTRERLTASGRVQPQQRIRSIGPGTVITIVRVLQSISSASGHTQTATDYAVTVIAEPNGWKAYDIEPATAGNQGGGA